MEKYPAHWSEKQKAAKEQISKWIEKYVDEMGRK